MRALSQHSRGRDLIMDVTDITMAPARSILPNGLPGLYAKGACIPSSIATVG